MAQGHCHSPCSHRLVLHKGTIAPAAAAVVIPADDDKYEHPILDFILDHHDKKDDDEGHKGYFLGHKWLRHGDDEGYRFAHHG